MKREYNTCVIGGIGSYKVISDDNMVETVPKTLRERITWKFWIKYKVIPRTDFLLLQSERVIVCHSTMKDKLEKEIELI